MKMSTRKELLKEAEIKFNKNELLLQNHQTQQLIFDQMKQINPSLFNSIY